MREELCCRKNDHIFKEVPLHARYLEESNIIAEALSDPHKYKCHQLDHLTPIFDELLQRALHFLAHALLSRSDNKLFINGKDRLISL